MKLLEILAKGIGVIWKFLSRTFTILLVFALIIFAFSIFIPENVQNSIEIFKNLFKIP